MKEKTNMGAVLDLEITLALKQLKERKWKLLKEFVIVGRAVPKARPRVGKTGTVMPKNYYQSQSDLITQFLLQRGNRWEKPIKCKLDFIFLGGFRGDADNLIGAYFDAMVKAEVLPDDRLSILPEGEWAHYPGKVNTPTSVIKLFVSE